MATVTTLPPGMRSKLDALGRRVRTLRAWRGVSILVLTLVGAAGVALLADQLLTLPSWIRVALFAGWCGLGAVAAWLALVRPLCRPVDPEALAALIEEKYPELGERLTTAVELGEDPAAWHGSRNLIALLVREAEARTRRLDVLPAFPARAVRFLVAGATLVLLVALTPALFWTQRYAELSHRFFLPWRVVPVVVPYALEVTPGDARVARGRPLVVTAVLRPGREGVTLPATCSLVRTDAEGRASTLRMLTDRADAFSLKLDKEVTGDFTYHVIAGEAVSPTFRVQALDPVELAADSPAVTITPPDYARSVLAAQSLTGLQDVTALQHATVRYDFRFTQPVKSAALTWSGGGQRQAPLDLHFTPDRLGAHVELPVLSSGQFHLTLTGEHGLDTAWDPWALHAQVDQPPAFLKVTGTERGKAPADNDESLRAVLPSDTIPLEFTAADDFGVARADVEYRVNDGDPAAESVKLDPAGAQQITTRHDFRLAERSLKEGDVVRYRLRVADTRRVPAANLEPQVAYHPADGRWLALKVSRQAESLRQQEILARRDDLAGRLEAIKNDLLKEQRVLYKLRQEAKAQPDRVKDQGESLKQLTRDNRAAEEALRELARDAAETPALQPLADKARQVADEELRRATESLRKAEKEPAPAPRDQQLQQADREVTSALEKLDELKRANERLAQARLDQMKLDNLAGRQQGLADRAAQQAARDPGKEADANPEAEKLQKDQGEVSNELQRLAEQSEPLRNALDQARADQAKELADQARDLAQAQRDLAEAARRQQKQGDLERLAKKQEALAKQAERLSQETRQPTQAARTDPLKPDSANKAAQELNQGNAGEALRNQEQSAQELERVAKDLDRANQRARDPREAARQLARLQEALRQQLKEQVKKQDPKRALASQLQDVGKEQEALRQAVENLSVPPDNAAAQKERKEAAELAKKAATAVYKPNPDEAGARMKEAAQALERLANQLPSLEDRQRKAQAEVDELRRRQQEIAQQAEKALQKVDKDKADDPGMLRQLTRQLADAAKKQAESAERLRKADAPQQEPRREQAEEALRRALTDLLDAKPRDIPESQREAERQLERLARALAGEKPDNDDKPQGNRDAAQGQPQGQPPPSPRAAAEALAKQQRQLAQQSEKAQQLQAKQGNMQALGQVEKAQRQLNREASQLPAREAPKALEQARQLMNQAEQALARTDANQARQKQNEAAQALDQLAKQLPERPAQQAARGNPDGAAPPQGMPSQQQAEQARQLAREQRALREEVQRHLGEADKAPADNPVPALAKQQQEIAQRAEAMARDVGQEQGARSQPTRQAQQAAESARQASRQMQSGSLPQAREAGQQTARQLRQLAQDLSQTPRGAQADPAGGRDPVQQARDLAQLQEHLNRQLKPLADQPELHRAQNQARQQDLQQQAGDLTRALRQLAQQMGRSPQAQQAASRAADSGKQAQEAMQQGQGRQQQGNQGQAGQAQQQAAQALDQAARQARQAGEQLAAAQQWLPQDGSQAGQAVQQAQGQMNQAQSQLSQGQPQSAGQAMQRAAQALQQAAQQLAQNGRDGKPTPDSQPSDQGVPQGGTPDPRLLPADMKQHAGKPWGELPGELRTRILQDMKAQYGDDYARVIKFYFEQIAETKKK